MPLIEPSSSRLRSTGSTYSFSIQTNTRPSCSTTRYGLSRSLPARALDKVEFKKTPKTPAKSRGALRRSLEKARDFANIAEDHTRGLRPLPRFLAVLSGFVHRMERAHVS